MSLGDTGSVVLETTPAYHENDLSECRHSCCCRTSATSNGADAPDEERRLEHLPG